MEHYQLTLAYDGTDFEGFQRQGSKRTVQFEFEQTLRKLEWDGKAILSAGRTDAGVHANGQVIAFDLDWHHSLKDLEEALNSRLPRDMAVREIKLAKEGFHPRFDAKARTYRYHIYFSEGRDPVRERYAWRLDWKLNRQILSEASQMINGTHNFLSFGRAMSPGASTERVVFYAGWRTSLGKELTFQITANAFLYHMVRRLVFLQVKLASGKMDLEDFQNGIKQQTLLPPGISPANGLFLHKIYYEENWQESMKFGFSR
jgi:tRNA pseudouridine38-40 synthase